MTVIQGISPVVAREVAYRSTGFTDYLTDDMSHSQSERLKYHLKKLKDILNGKGEPNLISVNGKPVDFTFLYPQQYGASAVSSPYDDYSAMLDEYYYKRDLNDRMKSRSQDLLKLLANSSARIAKKLDIQRDELKKCADREQHRRNGDLINANLHLLQKGDMIAEVVDYYSETCSTIKIKLDPLLTPAQNAQKYYKEYRKLQAAEQHLTELIGQGMAELAYIDSVLDLIVCNGQQPPNQTIEQAAQLAAYHSGARQSGLVAVDYTLIKYVSKPRGAKPGMVIYTHQSTLYVHPDEALAERLADKQK